MTTYNHPTAALRQAAQLIRQARRVLVLSGAGISKASGIPTYRDTDGLWETGDNLKFSHADAYYADPAAFAAFWRARQKSMKTVRPNPAHLALAELQRVKPGTSMVTQNVDGLLQAAGCVDVVALHGNLKRRRCGGGCGARDGRALLGRCLHCGARMRPDVVLFGENLSSADLIKAQTSATECDVVLVVGTSAVVAPASELPLVAMRFGAKLLVMDVEPPQLALAADIVLLGRAEALLPELVARVTAATL
jgi:NAD-dependent deacetylase